MNYEITGHSPLEDLTFEESE